jgi:hypothetical protein
MQTSVGDVENTAYVLYTKSERDEALGILLNEWHHTHCDRHMIVPPLT